MKPIEILPILYSFRRCPYAIRARMALRYARQRVHLREVVLRDKPDELLQASAQGTVPVLVLTNGEVIDESRDIMIWALEQNDRDGWLSVLVEEQAALIDLNDQRFKPLLDGYKYPGRHAKLDSPGCFQRALELFINPLEGQLKTQAFLFGSDMQLADVAVFPFVRQFDGVDKHALTEQDYPALRIWLNRMTRSDLFQASMKKFEPWHASDTPKVF